MLGGLSPHSPASSPVWTRGLLPSVALHALPMEKSKQKATEFTEGRTKHWRRLNKLESTTKSSSAGSKDMEYILDPMLACKQPNIGSGATAIGSAARAPDEDSRRRVYMQGAKHRVLTHKSSGAYPWRQINKFFIIIVMTPCHTNKAQALFNRGDTEP